MNLGEHFSDEEKVNFVERNLIPGHVIKLFCHTTKRPKEKRLAIVSLNPELLLFFINSEVPNFKQKSPYLKNQQISLKAEDNTEFLEHDSWLDCSASRRRPGHIHMVIPFQVNGVILPILTHATPEALELLPIILPGIMNKGTYWWD